MQLCLKLSLVACCRRQIRAISLGPDDPRHHCQKPSKVRIAQSYATSSGITMVPTYSFKRWKTELFVKSVSPKRKRDLFYSLQHSQRKNLEGHSDHHLSLHPIPWQIGLQISKLGHQYNQPIGKIGHMFKPEV